MTAVMETQSKHQNENTSLMGNEKAKPKMINTLSIILIIVVVVLVGVIIGLLAGYVFDDDEESTGLLSQNVCENCKPDNFPGFGYMYAPRTAFTEEINPETGEPDINYDAIPAMAQTAVDLGVNVLFIGGSNGQFYTMSVEERKTLVETWVNEIRALKSDVFIIWMVASTNLDDAKELADYAGNVLNVDAIASLPPYYDYYNGTYRDDYTNEELFDWFGEIVDASGGLPFFYYHLPQTTQFTPYFPALLRDALDNELLPMFSGIKYVSPYSASESQWREMTSEFGDRVALMSWNSPQSQFFQAPGRGIGGHDYFMPTFRCMRNAFLRGDMDDYYFYEDWQSQMSSLIYNTRCMYQTLSGVNLYDPRSPSNPINQTLCEVSLANLEDAGFFDELEEQKKCPLFI